MALCLFLFYCRTTTDTITFFHLIESVTVNWHNWFGCVNLAERNFSTWKSESNSISLSIPFFFHVKCMGRGDVNQIPKLLFVAITDFGGSHWCTYLRYTLHHIDSIKTNLIFNLLAFFSFSPITQINVHSRKKGDLTNLINESQKLFALHMKKVGKSTRSHYWWYSLWRDNNNNNRKKNVEFDSTFNETFAQHVNLSFLHSVLYLGI